MKKSIILMAAAAMIIAGCTKSETGVVDQQKDGGRLRFEFNVVSCGDAADTKALKTGWEPGDVIYLGFDKTKFAGTYRDVVTANYFMTLTYNADGSWSEKGYKGDTQNNIEEYEFTADDFNESGSLRAVYLGGENTPRTGSRLIIQTRTETERIQNEYEVICHTGMSLQADAAVAKYTVSDGTLRASIPMSPLPDLMQFSVTELEGTDWVLKCIGNSNLNGYYGFNLYYFYPYTNSSDLYVAGETRGSDMTFTFIKTASISKGEMKLLCLYNKADKTLYQRYVSFTCDIPMKDVKAYRIKGPSSESLNGWTRYDSSDNPDLPDFGEGGILY